MNLNDLDFSNIGSWPTAAKAIVIVLLFSLVSFGVYWFDTQDQLEKLASLEKEEITLKKRVTGRALRAANLDILKQQLVLMEKDFSKLRKQLPNKTEVAALLVDISQTGLSSGLEFELFKPEREIPKEFYAELPIKIRVTGSYHEFGEFVSGIAALPRIVTLHNIIMVPKKNDQMIMSATAKTYRYLEEGELGK
ncbi:MAG TPA: pilus assembly protein PilO [Gammaproteobacteria bacterium]|nr:pilus assembly protein PilO [Gammaproteobacteria bacterium]